MSEEIIEEVKDEAIGAGSGAAEGSVAEGTDGAVPNDGQVPAPSEESTSTEPIKYADFEVQVQVDDEVRSALTEKGLDADAIVKELYSSKDFSLTRETRDKLDAAFGAYFVDYYLKTTKLQNDSIINQHKQGVEAQAASVREAEEWGVQTVGGNWDDFEAKVLPLMSEAQIEQFNAAMASGNKLVQEYALKATMQLIGAEDQPAPEPEVPEIEVGGNSAPDTNGALSFKEYRDLMIKVRNETRGNPKAYREQMQALDARRAAGLARGI